PEFDVEARSATDIQHASGAGVCYQRPRDKLIMLLTANAISSVGEFYQEMPNADALSNFGALEFVQGAEEVEPGTAVEVALSGTAGPLEWDGPSLTYKYSYTDDNGQTHNVWLGNATALANRLRLAKEYNLGGVSVRGLGDVADGVGYAAALSSFLTNGESPTPESAAIVWTVRDSSNSVVASATGEELTFAWDGSEDAGDYTIGVDFSLGETVVPLDVVTVAVGDIAAEAVEEVAEEPAEETETAEAESSEAASGSAEGADATVKVAANIRYGPGVTYGIIANGLQAGTEVKVIGRDESSTWLNIIIPNGDEAWIYATLITVDPGVDVASLPIGEAREAPSVASSGGDTSSSGSAGSPPPPVSVPPVSNAGFELGGQVFGAPYGVMSQAGMTWVKRQHKWGPGNSPTDVAGMISQAHGGGMKILLSIPGPRYPDSLPDFNAFVEFLRGVAALPDPPDAIEIWNEQNIDAEWAPGNIDPALYVNSMLAPAYNAIKSANSSVMVVSGAPAPTGFDNGTNAWSDSRYISGMAAAGAGSYMDCVGVHYNEGIISPTQNSGDPRSEHYTRYFSGMMNTYWNTFGKPLCFTELGYLTGDGIGALPDRFSWAGNTTVGQQAQWLAEATSLSASSGKVRMLIVWNVDSTTWGDDPQSGYAIIRPGGSCPACATLGQVMGR
ncbi:MAG: hypothetical protein GWP17_06210, partial [Aquificales bacterium]|nr:hypothetical protein [Aquificales bacterium]